MTVLTADILAAIALLTGFADDLGLPRPMAVAIGWGESRLDWNAVNPAGAYGLVQINRRVHGGTPDDWLGEAGAHRSLDLMRGRWATATKAAPTPEDWPHLSFDARVDALARFWIAAQGPKADEVWARAAQVLTETEALLAAMGDEGEGMVVKPVIQYTDAHPDNYAAGRIHTDGRVIAPEAWVLHIAQGSFDGIMSWFRTGPADRNPPLPSSAHFSVAKDGRIRQHVSPINTAFANGIVQSGYTSRLIDENAGINPNLWTVSCEHEGMSGELPTEAMFEASAHLCAWVFETRLLPGGASGVAVDRDHIIRHGDISPIDRAGCPGWPERIITDYIDRVREHLAGPVEPPPIDDHETALIAELLGELRAFRDDEQRAAIRIERVRKELQRLGVPEP